jgi:DASS family divalent anion:Na+ symporter
LVLAVTMMRTGLLLRAALLLLRIFPVNYTGQIVGLLTAGVLSTPLMPLATARVAVVAPLTTELTQTLGHPPKSRASAGGLCRPGRVRLVWELLPHRPGRQLLPH